MSDLYVMVSIINRSAVKKFTALYEQYGVSVNFVTVGSGTAVNEILDAFGLEKTEKAVILSVITDTTWQNIKKGLQNKLKIDIPGTGIAFTIPLSSIGGKKPLFFLRQKTKF